MNNQESDTDRNGFLSYAAEWHALTHGLYDGLKTWRLRAPELPDNPDVQDEPHYYMGGFLISTVFHAIIVGAVALAGRPGLVGL